MALDDKKVVFKVEVDDSGVITKLKSTTKGIEDIDLSSKNAKQSVDRLTSSITKVGSGGTLKNVKLTTKELEKLKNEVGGLSNKSGAAAATTLELGRVISDAPYGIRGMANNVSQVASQMAFMSNSIDVATGKAIGFSGAVKQVWASMMGPLGILLAIQAVIAAVDYFAGSTKKAEEATEDMDKALKAQIRTLKLYEASLMDSNTTLEQRVGILKGLSTLDKELAKALKEAGDDQEKLTELTKRYREQKELELAIKTAKAKLDELSLKTDKAALSVSKQQAYLDSDAEIRAKTRSELDKKLLLSKTALNLAQNEQNDAFGAYLLLLAKLEDKNKIKPTRLSKKVYKEALLDLDDFILKQQQKEELATTRTEERKLAIKQKYAKEELALELSSWIEKEKLRLKNFKASNATPKAKAEAERVSNAAILDAQREYGEALTQLDITQASETAMFKEKQRNKEIDAEFKYRKKKIDNLKAFYDEEKIARDEEQIRLEEERIAKAERDAELLPEESTERFLAEVKIAEMRMALQTRELDHELMIIQAKKNANMEYVNYMGNIGGLLSALSGQSEGMAKAALLVQKGSAIAKIIVETTASNAKIASQGLALAFETGGASVAAAGKMVIANRINAGISIATILAQTISSMSNKGGGGASGGGAAASSGRTFDFNLAGSTGQNQLAQTIGGQVQQPIKAYVVSSEITNQQQFDNQIQGEVTIG